MSEGKARPKVLHIITRLIVGGAQWNTLYTCRGLNEGGRFDAVILSGKPIGSEGELVSKAEEFGIEVVLLDDQVREIDPIRDVRAFIKMVRFIRKGNFQIVHTHSSKAGILGRLAGWVAGVPIRIHTVHGWSFHNQMSRVTRRAIVTLEKMLSIVTDAYIIVTRADQQKGREVGIGDDGKYILIRSGIDYSRFDGNCRGDDSLRKELGLDEECMLIGSLGRLSAQKSPLDFVRLAKGLSEEIENVAFLYLGDGPLRSDFEHLTSSLGLSEKVHLLGMRHDVNRVMGALDIYVHTSRWEGLPRAFLEATACGVPVVATAVDGAVEFFEDGINGFLVAPGDIPAMAVRVKELLLDHDLRQKIVERARERMGKEYSVESMVKEIETLYWDLLRKKGLIDSVCL